MKKFLILFIALFISSIVNAEEEKTVEIPIIFTSPKPHLKTSACLRIKEKLYDSDWENFKKTAQTFSEKALVEIMTAIQQKNDSRFKALAHPEFVSDTQEFEKQQSAYFQQFDGIQISGLKGYLKFDNFIVFYPQLKFKDKVFVSDFPFIYDENAISFIRTPQLHNGENPVYDLANDWFQSDWGPVNNQSPVYCEPSTMEKVTHEVTWDDANRSDSAAKLLLVGATLDQNSPYVKLFNQITKMQTALASGRMEEYFEGFTQKAKENNQNWFLQEKEENLRRLYVENFTTLKPFFVFDANPIYAVYSHTKSPEVKVSYFELDSEGQFKLTDESIGYPRDRIFKGKKFMEAAKEEKPFLSLEIIRK